MSQHEPYTFPPGMRIYDEQGVARDPLTSGGSGGGVFLTETKALPQSGILALPDTPFELVPAPSDPTKVNMLVAVVIISLAGIVYTFSAPNLNVGYASDPQGDGFIMPIPAGNLNSSSFPVSFWTAQPSAYPATVAGNAIVLTYPGTVSGGTRTAKITSLYFLAG